MSKKVEVQKYIVFDGEGAVIAAGTLEEVANVVTVYADESDEGLADFSIAEIGTPRKFEFIPASIKLS